LVRHHGLSETKATATRQPKTGQGTIDPARVPDEHCQQGTRTSSMRTQVVNFFVLVVLASLGMPAGANARTTDATCQTIDKAQVIALFDKWNQALQTRRTDAVVADYAPDATLLPTVQNGPLVGRPSIATYFDYFLKQSPVATIDTRVIHTGCNIAYDIGLYTFMVDGDQPGSRKQVKARYTFIYAPVHGKWLIEHHHSSAQPVPPQ
jgi:uncharacterized protein (TIGR02246 family)